VLLTKALSGIYKLLRSDDRSDSSPVDAAAEEKADLTYPESPTSAMRAMASNPQFVGYFQSSLIRAPLGPRSLCSFQFTLPSIMDSTLSRDTNRVSF
jgi:hypothetical protein